MKDDQIIVFKTELAPCKAAFQSLSSNCGGARFAYNYMLSWSKSQHELFRQGLVVEPPKLNMYALRKQWNIEKVTAAPWWAENEKDAYASSMDGLAKSYKNFFERSEVGYPKYKNADKKTATLQTEYS